MLWREKGWEEAVKQGESWFICPEPKWFVSSSFQGMFEGIFLARCFGFAKLGGFVVGFFQRAEKIPGI